MKNLGKAQAANIDRIASEIKWIRTMIKKDLEVLSRAIYPPRNYPVDTPSERAVISGLILQQLTLDCQRLIKEVNRVRRIGQDFIDEARK